MLGSTELDAALQVQSHDSGSHSGDVKSICKICLYLASPANFVIPVVKPSSMML